MSKPTVHVGYAQVPHGVPASENTQLDDASRPGRIDTLTHGLRIATVSLRLIIAIIIAASSGLLLALLLSLNLPFPSASAPVGPASPETCGTSPEEARSLGCVYDVMSFAWLPPKCHDESLTEMFLRERQWRYFTSDNATVELEEVRKGEFHDLFVSMEYHLVHCVYMSLKMQRAVLRQRTIDGYTMDPEHTSHCGQMLLDKRPDMGRRVTPVFSRYPVCSSSEGLGKVGWYVMEDEKPKWRVEYSDEELEVEIDVL